MIASYGWLTIFAAPELAVISCWSSASLIAKFDVFCILRHVDIVRATNNALKVFLGSPSVD